MPITSGRRYRRIDQVLLDNLTQLHKLLCKSLSSDAAQALLIQTIFIAYLEDRKIITPDYVMTATNKAADSFSALLAKHDVRLLKLLFATLRDDFNGDLFVAPCSFDLHAKAPTVQASHLDVIASFRTGREEMAKQGQYRFWGYDFRYIPVNSSAPSMIASLARKKTTAKHKALTTRRCTSRIPSCPRSGIC